MTLYAANANIVSPAQIIAFGTIAFVFSLCESFMDIMEVYLHQ
jgi:hypothetical protein